MNRQDIKSRLSRVAFLGSQGDRLAEEVEKILAEERSKNAAPAPAPAPAEATEAVFAAGFQAGITQAVEYLNEGKADGVDPSIIEVLDAVKKSILEQSATAGECDSCPELPLDEAAKLCNMAREAVKNLCADKVDQIANETTSPTAKKALKEAADKLRELELIQSAIDSA